MTINYNSSVFFISKVTYLLYFLAVLMSESKSGGKRHTAPQYLERRKDKRRSSESAIQTRLKLRRSSRARKDKGDVSNALIKHCFFFSQ